MNKKELKKIIKEAFQIVQERGAWYDLPNRNTNNSGMSTRNTQDQQDSDLERDELFAAVTSELMDEEGDEFKKQLIKAIMTGDLLADILDDIESPEIKDLIFRSLGKQDEPFTDA